MSAIGNRCLINQPDCGRVAGIPVCPKCGMDERVVYPGQADLEAALEAARARYVATQEAVEPPPPPETPKPPAPPVPSPQPPMQPDPEYLARPGGHKTGINRLGLGVLVMALLGGGWWWKDQQDQRLRLAQEQAASQALAAEQARSMREAEKQRADEAEAQRVAAERAQAQVAEQARREREAKMKSADDAKAQRVAAEKAQAQIAEQARREREAEKKSAEDAEAQRVAAEKAQALIAEKDRREREAAKKRVDEAERAARVVQERQTATAMPAPPSAGQAVGLLHGRYQIVANGSEIKDIQTGLTWARCSVGQHWDGISCLSEPRRYTFSEAQGLAGAGWRLPTVRELLTLVHCSTSIGLFEDSLHDGEMQVKSGCVGNDFIRPAIRNDIFPGTGKEYWSSSLFPLFSSRRSTSAQGIAFSDGFVAGFVRNGGVHVRLVRTNQ